MKIICHGGAGTVTGANFLVETDEPGYERLLLDCGLLQGGRIFEEVNLKPFPYSPAEIKAVFISHAHIDHIGRLPRLVKQGFSGPIYSTAATKAIAELNLLDSLGVMTKEARAGGHDELLYQEEDVAQTMRQWQARPYNQALKPGQLTVTLRNAGHILGSAMIELTGRSGKKFLFTGDLGNSPAPLLPDTYLPHDIDYLMMESVYGDREHEGREERTKRLERIIEDVLGRGGILLVPAFSIERTQELLFEIENLVEEGRVPAVPVYLDSPLAIQVTKIYRDFLDELNLSAQDRGRLADGIFRFPRLRQTLTTEESKAIFGEPGPKIIIAGSGMSNGGRIIHHEKHYLGEARNGLLLVGYQAAGSLGRFLLEGAKQVKILGEEINVRAEIFNLTGYSAHRDSPGLVEFVRQSADTLKEVFVVLGETKSSLYLVQRLRDYLGINARAPQAGETITLPL